MNPFDLADRLVAGVASRWRNLYYRIRGVHLRGYVLLRAIEIPRNHADIEIEGSASLDRGVVLLCSGPSGHGPKIKIGPGTYINRNTMLDASEGLEIGRDYAIGPGCYLTDHDHTYVANVPPLSLPLVSMPTCLEDCVWLGAKVVVLKGVTIGTGTVVGAGSVVTRSLPAHCVAAGVPARVLRMLDTTTERANAVALEPIVGR